MAGKSLPYYLTEQAKAAGCRFRAPRYGDVGYDIHASEPTTLFPGEQTSVLTGLYLAIPPGREGKAESRSSLAKRRIYVKAGVFDWTYRGEIVILLENMSKYSYHIEPGDRIAQLIIRKVESELCTKEVLHVEDLGETARGSAGFGSTGK